MLVAMSDSDRPDLKIRIKSKEFSFDVVTYTIQLEELITMIICLQLSKDWMKTHLYMDYFDKVGFDSKISLAETILTINYPKILEQHPTIFEEIRFVKDLRNLVAHRSRHYEMDYDGKNTKFVLHHRKIAKQIRLDETEMKERVLRVENCLDDVRKMVDSISKEFGMNGIV